MLWQVSASSIFNRDRQVERIEAITRVECKNAQRIQRKMSQRNRCQQQQQQQQQKKGIRKRATWHCTHREPLKSRCAQPEPEAFTTGLNGADGDHGGLSKRVSNNIRKEIKTIRAKLESNILEHTEMVWESVATVNIRTHTYTHVFTRKRWPNDIDRWTRRRKIFSVTGLQSWIGRTFWTLKAGAP